MSSIKFNIEEEFNFSLKKLGLNKAKLSKDELVERKRTFIAGASIMFSKFWNLNKLTEQEAVIFLENTNNTLVSYWKDEIKNTSNEKTF